MSRSLWWYGLVLSVGAGVLGCSDQGPSGRTRGGTPPSGLFVSAPGPPPALRTLSDGRTARVLASDSVAYVSLAPGTIPGGVAIRIENGTGLGLFQGTLTDGGLNPVPVPATTRDTLQITTTDSLGRVAVHQVTVRARPPLRVVRTQPGVSRVDVSLNSLIGGVFSGPLDPASVTPTTMQLVANGQPVAGQTSIAPDGYEVTFTPVGGLAPLTGYELVITTGIHSEAGEPLAAETRLSFATGPQALPATTLAVSPAFGLVLLNGSLQLTAEARDALGNAVTGATSWSEVDSGDVVVSSTGLATAVLVGGPDRVVATHQGLQASASILVVQPSTINLDGGWDFTEIVTDPTAGVTCSDTGSTEFSQLGTRFVGAGQQVGTCAGPAGLTDNQRSALVSFGSLDPGRLRFQLGSCFYSGAFSGPTPADLSGTVECAGSSGIWQAGHNRPAASLAILGGPGTLARTASVRLEAALRDAAGRRLFFRPTLWSTADPTVVSVTPDGLLTALGSGATTVTASAGGLQKSIAVSVP